ncbi:MAG: NAD(P)-dependent oxidoreductase [Clostridiales Family XIII bacterium]|nr:NAD(P)-dependent oxidoreductase [Clostridiales Family XIII bacterium]
MKTVLVTGSSGYIGKHVVAALLAKDHLVIANDLVPSNTDAHVTNSTEDIFSGEKDIYERLGKPDIVIHLAWEAGFIHNSPLHLLRLSDHFRFLTDMAAGGCKNIAVMGSMHEVGFYEGAITEDTPCNPLSLYGIAKNALRQALLLESKQNDFNLYWLRGYYIYGDDRRGSSIFSKIARAADAGEKEFPFTTGKNKYDFISIDGLATQIVAASTQTKVSGVINVCSGKAVSLAEQVEAFIKENDFDITLKYGAFPDREYDSGAIWGDDTKIQTILLNEKF